MKSVPFFYQARRTRASLRAKATPRCQAVPTCGCSQERAAAGRQTGSREPERSECTARPQLDLRATCGNTELAIRLSRRSPSLRCRDSCKAAGERRIRVSIADCCQFQRLRLPKYNAPVTLIGAPIGVESGLNPGCPLSPPCELSAFFRCSR